MKDASHGAVEGSPRPVARVRLRTIQHRRRRVVRSVLGFAVVAAIVVLAAITQRDEQARRSAEIQGERIALAFQNSFDAEGVPPSRFPQDEEIRSAISRFDLNPFYATRPREASRVGVCVSRSAIGLYLREAGRIVVTFDGRVYRSEWMPDTEYRAQADALGLPRPKH